MQIAHDIANRGLAMGLSKKVKLKKKTEACLHVSHCQTLKSCHHDPFVTADRAKLYRVDRGDSPSFACRLRSVQQLGQP